MGLPNWAEAEAQQTGRDSWRRVVVDDLESEFMRD
jgi:hypothetical protein